MANFPIIVIDSTELNVQVEPGEFRMSLRERGDYRRSLPDLHMTREQLTAVRDQFTKLLEITANTPLPPTPPFQVGDRVRLRPGIVPEYLDAGVVTHMELHAGLYHYRFANGRGQSRSEPETYLEAAT